MTLVNMILTRIIAAGLLLIVAVSGCSTEATPTDSKGSVPPPATQPLPAPPKSEPERPTSELSVPEAIGSVPVPFEIVTHHWGVFDETKSIGHRMLILWPRLAGLLTQSVLGVKEESAQRLEALPGRLEEITKHYDLESSSVWIRATFSPDAMAELPDGPTKVSELVLYAEQPGEATLFLRTETRWLSYVTTTTYEEIQRYVTMTSESHKDD